MFGLPPLILNDFEAEAWALTGSPSSALTPIGATPGISLEAPGTYCVMGITSGLGVSVLTRNRSGSVHVLATEAGHGGFAPASRAMAELTGAMFPHRYPIVAEQLISANGLMAIYDTLAGHTSARKLATPEDITRLSSSDPAARRACEMLCEAFWTYASSLVLTYGAWDGVVVTGGMAAALRSILGSPRMETIFTGTGKHMRPLAAVPRVTATMNHCELVGTAKALQGWQNRPSSH
jgi:glucokinase